MRTGVKAILAATIVIAVFAAGYLVAHKFLNKDCFSSDNIAKLCVIPVNGQASSKGTSIPLFQFNKSRTIYEVDLDILYSPNPWSRYREAVKWLRAHGYEVKDKDVKGVTILFVAGIRAFKPEPLRNAKFLTGIAANRTIVYKEYKRYGLGEKVIIIGNITENRFFALKIKNGRILSAAELVFKPVNITINKSIIPNTCQDLAEIVKKYKINYSVEYLLSIGVPHKLCNERIYKQITYKLYIIRGDRDAVYIGAGSFARRINVLDDIYSITYSETASVLSGAAKSVAKMTVWWLGSTPVHVRDESHCDISWWAWFLGIWKKDECDHTAFLTSTYPPVAHVDCYGKFIWITVPSVTTFCASAKVDVSTDKVPHKCSNVCACGEECPCPAVLHQSCRQACDPCYGCNIFG